MSLGAWLATDSSLGRGMPEGLSRAWKGLGVFGFSFGVPRFVPAVDIVWMESEVGGAGGEGTDQQLGIYVLKLLPRM
jgi:hypothetical protein